MFKLFLLISSVFALTNAMAFLGHHGQQPAYPGGHGGFGMHSFGQQLPAKPAMGGYTPMSMTGIGPMGGMPGKHNMGGKSGMGAMGGMGGMGAMSGMGGMGAMGGMGGMGAMSGMGGMGAMGGMGGMGMASPYSGMIQQLMQPQQPEMSFGRSYKFVPEMPADMGYDYDDEDDDEFEFVAPPRVQKKQPSRKVQNRKMEMNDYDDDEESESFNQMSPVKSNQKQNSKQTQTPAQMTHKNMGNKRQQQAEAPKRESKMKTLKSSSRPSSKKEEVPETVEYDSENVDEAQETAVSLKSKTPKSSMFDEYNWKYDAFKTDNDSKKDQEEHVSLLNNRNKKSQTKNKYQDAELSYAVVPNRKGSKGAILILQNVNNDNPAIEIELSQEETDLLLE